MKRRRLQESIIPEQPLGAPEPDEVQALSEPATVQGYVAKSGPTKLQYWTAANRTERHQLFEQWLQAAYGSADPREAGQAVTVTGGMEMRNLPPMYPNCQILVVSHADGAARYLHVESMHGLGQARGFHLLLRCVEGACGS